MDAIIPFRWDVTKRNSLGRLIDERLEVDEAVDPDWANIAASAHLWGRSWDYPWFLDELRRCSARTIAFCDNADLCFVGRSPDSLFDYLSGLLFDTSWSRRLTLLPFSMRFVDQQTIIEERPSSISEFRKVLVHLRLDPQQLARRPRPVAFVDIVASGSTLGNLFGLLHSWCKDIAFDWAAVQRKIRIVGLTEQRETSPKIWRWQQHAEWVSLLEPGSIKNVPIPEVLFDFMGAGQPKATRSFTSKLWGNEDITQPVHDYKTLAGLRLAAALFDSGRQTGQRLEFARELSKQPAMQYPWFRPLIAELKV